MGKGLPRILPCRDLRGLHTAARQRRTRDHFWSPSIKGLLPEKAVNLNSTDHLINAGLVSQSNAGVFHFLPLGLRVLEKIEKLLDKHMRSIGASKVALSALSNQNLWQKSGRLHAGGELFKFTDRGKTSWLLAPTHEEEITQLLKSTGLFKTAHGLDSSLRLYQIGRKYRDELRPRGGLLRGKEFLMKDLYTFDRTPEDAHTTYDHIRGAYRRFFDELGLPYVEARADSGNMGGKLSHEYHFPSDQGEDTVITCSNCDLARNVEYVPPIDRTVTKLHTKDAPNTSIEVEASSMASRDFISSDHSTLVRVLVPTKDVAGASIDGVKSLINTHALKAALDGLVDVATGIDEAAARKIFSNPTESNAVPRKRQVYYILDRRLSTDHLVLSLRESKNELPAVESWAVQSTTHSVSPSSAIDLLLPKDGDSCLSCAEGKLKVQKAIEIGHTFFLGTRYSDKFQLKATSSVQSAPAQLVQMGCYGIGVSRLVAAAAHFPARLANPTVQPLVWPNVIAPFDVCVISIWAPGMQRSHEPEVESARKIYDFLEDALTGEEELDILLDTRPQDKSAKLADSLATGIPILVWRNHNSPDTTVMVKCSRLEFDEEVELRELPDRVRELRRRLSERTSPAVSQ